MDYTQKEKIKRISESILKGKVAKPFFMNIRPSYQCNLNCLSCIDHPNKNGHAISDEKYLDLVKEALSLGIREWRIDGGAEPLIRKNLCINIMSLIKEGGTRGILTTNGTLLEEEDIKKLVEIGWDCINISIQAPNAKLDNLLRGSKTAFERTTKSLELFKWWKKKMAKDVPMIRLTPLIHKMNYTLLQDFIKMGKKYDTQVTFQAFAVWSEKGKHLKLSEEDIKRIPFYVKKAREYADKHKVYTDVERLLEQNLLKNTNQMEKVLYEDLKTDSNTGLLCYEPWYFMLVTELGFIGRCIGDFESKISIAEKSLKEIWYGPNFNDLREKIIKRNLPNFCSRCCHPQVMETRKIRKEILEFVEQNVY